MCVASSKTTPDQEDATVALVVDSRRARECHIALSVQGVRGPQIDKIAEDAAADIALETQ